MTRPTATRSQTPKLQATVVDAARDRTVLRSYVTALALKDSYSVSFEKAGIIVRTFSLGQIKGIKNLELDMVLFKRLQGDYRLQVMSAVTDFLNRPGTGWAEYVAYINKIAERTRQLQLAMDELRAEVMKHNQKEIDLAGAWGRFYSKVKFGADVAVGGLSVATGGAGGTIGRVYTFATEAIAIVGDPKKADIFAFKGTGANLVFLAAEKKSERVLTELGNKVLIGGPAMIVTTLFAWNDYKDNTKMFE